MTRKKRREAPPPPAPVVVDAALARARSLLSAEDYAALTAELERPLRTAIRLNPLKAEAADLAGWASRYGWQVEPVPYCPAGWWLNSAEISPAQTPEHRLGYFYIQDAASMLPVELFDFTEPPTLLLDLAGDSENGAVQATHQELAEMLGTWRETVSKTLQEMRRSGLVSPSRRSVRILDRQKLRQEAEGG